mgnify:FL=1
MKQNKLISSFILIVILFSFKNSYGEIIILSSCNNQKDVFLKNEYTLDLEKLLMTRNYVYNEKTFKKYRVTDLSVKKNNTLTKFIYREDNKILTDKVGYPQFYTQLVFKIDNLKIMIKTFINNKKEISLLSKCKKIERFKKES